MYIRVTDVWILITEFLIWKPAIQHRKLMYKKKITKKSQCQMPSRQKVFIVTRSLFLDTCNFRTYFYFLYFIAIRAKLTYSDLYCKFKSWFKSSFQRLKIHVHLWNIRDVCETLIPLILETLHDRTPKRTWPRYYYDKSVL